MPLIAAAAVALTVFFVSWLLVQARQRPANVDRRLESLDRAQPENREDILAQPFSARVGVPMARRLTGVAAGVLPARIGAAFERNLILAGRPMQLSQFLVVQLVAAGAALAVLLLTLASGNGSGIMLLLMGAGVLLLALAPYIWLRARVSARQQSILKALPDAVDLMVTTVEAGLGIDAALSEVGRETAGALGQELQAAVRETTLGRSRREALLNLTERTRVPELRAFILAIIQAEQTGIPIGQVLRIQADQMRIRRRQLAEAAAQRSPVKMTLILVILVLPAMILMVMGPAFMRMRDVIN